MEKDIRAIKLAGDECYSTARETSGLCRVTISKAHEMVAFGQELQATLNAVTPTKNSSSKSRGIDDSKFAAVIGDLVDGEKIRSAATLAKELSGLSLECVDKSVRMISSMERGIDALPDAVEPFVENKISESSKKGARKGDPELPDVEGSVRDLQKLVKDVETVNVFTIVESGSAAFDGLRKNGELSKDMFSSMKKFADDVESVSGSFRDFDIEDTPKMLKKITTVAQDAWRCLRLSGLMKLFAEKVGLLIKWMINLFEMVSKKLGRANIDLLCKSAGGGGKSSSLFGEKTGITTGNQTADTALNIAASVASNVEMDDVKEFGKNIMGFFK